MGDDKRIPQKVSRSYSVQWLLSMADSARWRCPSVVVVVALVSLATREEKDIIKEIQRWTFGYFKT